MSVVSVWGKYVPPRGQCNYRPSIVSPKCPCLRFMLHPLKSNSSFECDGCMHHASFHSMENKEEVEIYKRWEQEAREKAQREERDERPRKKPRAIEFPHVDELDNALMTPDEETASGATSTRPAARPKLKAKKKASAPASARARPKGRITEIPEDVQETIELD